MTTLEQLELIILRARDKVQWQITQTPEPDIKTEDIVTYKVLQEIAAQLTRYNKEHYEYQKST